MADDTTSDLGRAIQDVSEKASLLVREEIELAKAEMSEKINKLIRGVVVGVVAGIFAVFGLVYLLHAISWLLFDLLGGSRNFWLGFIIVAGVLFLLGVIAGLVAARLVKRGTPPTPARAIEEAQLIKQTVTSSQPSLPEGPAATTPARPGGNR